MCVAFCLSLYLVLGKPWALFVYKTPEYIHVIYVYAPAVSVTLCPKRLLSNHAAANPLGVYALSEIKTSANLPKNLPLLSSHPKNQKHAATVNDHTRTVAPCLFSNWRIGDRVLGQAAVLSTVGVGLLKQLV